MRQITRKRGGRETLGPSKVTHIKKGVNEGKHLAACHSLNFIDLMTIEPFFRVEVLTHTWEKDEGGK